MSLNDKLDQVLGAVRQLADAPETSNVRELQDQMRSSFSTLPMPKRPSGTETDVRRGLTLTPDEPGKLMGESTPWGAEKSDPTSGSASAAPDVSSSEDFADHVPVSPGEVVAGFCISGYQPPYGCVLYEWITGFTRSDDGRVLCVEIFRGGCEDEEMMGPVYLGIKNLAWIP